MEITGQLFSSAAPGGVFKVASAGCATSKNCKTIAGPRAYGELTRLNATVEPMPLFLNESAGADRGLICGYQLREQGPRVKRLQTASCRRSRSPTQ